jgi:hypothetical protein
LTTIFQILAIHLFEPNLNYNMIEINYIINIENQSITKVYKKLNK